MGTDTAMASAVGMGMHMAEAAEGKAILRP